MKAIPKIWADLPLSDYAEEFGGETLRVWLNPTLDIVTARGKMLQASARMMTPGLTSDETIETLNQRMFEWLASVVEGITLAEIQAAYGQSPDFVMWLLRRVTQMMDEHSQHKKKALTPR